MRSTVRIVRLCIGMLVLLGSLSAHPVTARAGMLGGRPALQASTATVGVRVGYFPNVTHAQAMIGLANGTVQRLLGPEVAVRPFLFNAGPSAVEALFGGAIDLAYVGPNPAINAYVRSRGEAVRIVAGACSGGAALVVRSELNLRTPRDFRGRRIATPQLGNTQDVAARSWARANGLILKEKGGDVEILPVKNPDQLALFLKKEIDAAWTVEPWASRLILEAGGSLFLDERTLWPNGRFTSVVLLASTSFMKNNPDLVARWLRAHVETTRWIEAHKGEAARLVNHEVERAVGKSLRADAVDDAFSRLEFTYDPIKSSVNAMARAAYELGFLGREWRDLAPVYDLTLLNTVLKENGLAPLP